MGIFDTLSHLSSGIHLQEAQTLVEQLANSELTDEQRAWVQRLRELLDSLESNNSLGLFL